MFKEKLYLGMEQKCLGVLLKKENFVADDACTTHPHNFYAQMIAETGIIGLITMLSIFLLICYKFILNFYSICFKKTVFN